MSANDRKNGLFNKDRKSTVAETSGSKKLPTLKPNVEKKNSFDINSLGKKTSRPYTYNLNDDTVALVKYFSEGHGIKYSELVETSILFSLQERQINVMKAKEEVYPFFRLDKEIRKWFKMRPTKFEKVENFELMDDYLDPKFLKKMKIVNPYSLELKLEGLRKNIEQLPDEVSVDIQLQLNKQFAPIKQMFLTQVKMLEEKVKSQLETLSE